MGIGLLVYWLIVRRLKGLNVEMLQTPLSTPNSQLKTPGVIDPKGLLFSEEAWQSYLNKTGNPQLVTRNA